MPVRCMIPSRHLTLSMLGQWELLSSVKTDSFTTVQDVGDDRTKKLDQICPQECNFLKMIVGAGAAL